MTDTASVRIYKLSDGYDLEKLKQVLTDTNFSLVGLKDKIQTANHVILKLYRKESFELPDWVKLIYVYLLDSHQFDDYKRYSSLLFIFLSDDDNKRCYVISGGNGAASIQGFFDYHFGIEILERIFDPDSNKLDAVREKGIVGDILASSRFYRRSRAFAYEDDFGKYFQDLDLKIDKNQITKYFPSIVAYKQEKLKGQVSISCSASIELKMKVNLITVLNVVKDLVQIEKMAAPKIFNKSLVPLTSKRDSKEITRNYFSLRKEIFTCLKAGTLSSLDIDVCPFDFEKFFKASSFRLVVGLLHRNSKSEPEIDYPSGIPIAELEGLAFLDVVYKNILTSVEYIKSTNREYFVKQYLSNIIIQTLDSDGELLTSGLIVDYIQTEIKRDAIYFLLDKSWYRLQSEFDKSLTEKYRIRVAKKITRHSFYKKWMGDDETAYNKQYASDANALYMHLIKVDYIELCDIIWFDHSNKKTYLIHVKKDCGASIRDLVSQLVIAARIIEEDVATGRFDRIKTLYHHAVTNERINPEKLNLDTFIKLMGYNREYCMAIYDPSISFSDFESGEFASRIAKFSLVEYAAAMNANGFNYSINLID